MTIGYGDREGYDRTEPGLRDAAHAHDERLRDGGAGRRSYSKRLRR